MQDNSKEFDLAFRSALADAEETPSPRVWKAVESRLPEVSVAPVASHRTGFSWGWAAAGLAMAAAVAAALFFTGTNSNLDNNTLDSPLVAEATAPAAAPVLPDAGTVPAEGEAAAAPAAEKPLSSMVQTRHIPVQETSRPAAEFTGVPEGAPAEDDAPAEAPADESAEAAPAIGQPSQGTGATAQPAPEPETDPFSQLLFEDRQAGRNKVRISAVAGGTLGGNDASSGNPAYGIYGGEASIPDEIKENSESQYSIPFSAGIGLRFAFTPRLSLGTGVEYSLLSRTFTGSGKSDALSVSNGTFRHSVQYIGIPLNLYYNLLQAGSLSIYVYGGGEGELPLSSKYSVADAPGTFYLKDPASGVLLSAALGAGVEFRLGEHIGLYIDPSARYYFSTSSQPKSIRTEKPFFLNFNTGIRYEF